MKISDAVLGVLNGSRVDDRVVYLPDRQLDRKLYSDVNKVLEGIGGKWNRKLRGHVFSSDPGDALSKCLSEGQVAHWKQELQFFETPEAVIDLMLDHARLFYGAVVLEPSAGRGAIAKRLLMAGCVVDCCEKHEPFRDELRRFGDLRLLPEADFLEVAEKYSRIVANPPFSRGADVKHVNHMLDLLLDGGTLVTLMSAGVTFKTTADVRELMTRLDEECEYEFIDLPSGAFRSSGTMVNVVLLVCTRWTRDGR